MLDFMGKELSVGDTVIMIAPGYRHFCKGTIISFTARLCRVEYYNDWNYPSSPLQIEMLQDGHQLVKVNV